MPEEDKYAHQKAYHKRTGYKYITAWQKEHGYVTFSFRTHKGIVEGIKALAKEKGVPISHLIVDAIEGFYGVEFEKGE